MILFAGDPHGQFSQVIEAVRQHRPAAVVLLGDVQAQLPLHIELEEVCALTEVYWIHGNHDTDSDADHDHLWGSELAHRSLHGQVVEIGALRVAGLGGIFRSQVWWPGSRGHAAEPAAFHSPGDFVARAGKGNRWRGGLIRKHRSTIFPSDIEQLAGQRADILVTHEAPSCHPHGFAEIDALARRLGVQAAFHGHHHVCQDYRLAWPELGFKAHGVGFRGLAMWPAAATPADPADPADCAVEQGAI